MRSGVYYIYYKYYSIHVIIYNITESYTTAICKYIC